MKKIVMSAMLFCATASAQQINPATQINWPLSTGSGAPTAACSASNYGQPYLDTTTGTSYVCGASGWAATSGGSFVSLVDTSPQTMAGSLAGTTFSATTSVTTPLVNHIVYASSALPIASACSSLSGVQGTVMVTDAQTISTTTILPINCGLQVLNGASITVASGQYLQIAGPFQAGLYQTFYGPGAVYFYGGSGPKEVVPQWFGAMGNAKASGWTGTAGNATITIANVQVGGASNWTIGDPVTLIGGGVSGATYTTSITAVGTSTVTVATAPSTTVSGTPEPIYNVDDSAALNAWASSLRGNFVATATYDSRAVQGPSLLYVPKGQYNVCSAPVQIYTGTVVKFEASNTLGSAQFIQCNPATVAAIQLVPYSFNPAGVLQGGSGNGNNTLNYLDVRGGFGMSGEQAPAIQFLSATNLVSDTRLNHPMCESISGACIQVGYKSTVSAAAGATTITVANAYALWNSGAASAIIIPGAGASGGTYTGNVTAGGSSNSSILPYGTTATLTVTPAITTAVTNAPIYKATDSYGIWIEKPEIDVGYYFLEADGNATGSLWVDNGEIFSASQGAAVANDIAHPSLRWNNNKCYTCGSPLSATANQNFAIYWPDASVSNAMDVTVDNSSFNGTASAETAGIWVANARSFQLKNSQLWYSSGTQGSLGVTSENNTNVDLEGNTVTADISTGSQTFFYFPSNGTSLIAKNNTLDLLNVPTGNVYGFYFVTPPLSGDISGNQFIGAGINAPFWTPATGAEGNRVSFDGTSIRQQNTAAPTTGTWQVGDVIWNSAPAVGSPRGWVNTVAGTPGTWEPFGGVGYTFPTLTATTSVMTPSLTLNGGTATGYHGSSGTKVQLSDGTGTSQGTAYASDGSLTAVPQGTATLVSGTTTVSTTSACAVGSTCIYHINHCAPNSSTAIGSLSIGTITAGTSFVINALSPTNTVLTGDLSTVCWSIN